MVQIISATANAVAFSTTDEVTADDYKNIILPAVRKLIETNNEINFLFFIETQLEGFSVSAWLEDLLIGLRNLGKWHRAAIVTNTQTAASFTKSFRYIASGELRTYAKERLDEAVGWISGNDMPYTGRQADLLPDTDLYKTEEKQPFNGTVD